MLHQAIKKGFLLWERKFFTHMITEDTLWLADYFDNTSGEEPVKDKVTWFG